MNNSAPPDIQKASFQIVPYIVRKSAKIPMRYLQDLSFHARHTPARHKESDPLAHKAFYFANDISHNNLPQGPESPVWPALVSFPFSRSPLLILSNLSIRHCQHIFPHHISPRPINGQRQRLADMPPGLPTKNPLQF